MSDLKCRCAWAGSEPIYVDYHDNEWGRPVHDDRQLFAKLILDGAQAGLSWITILRKKPGYEAAFDNFDYEKIALYDDDKVQELMQNPSIVRNRLKIQSTITNARAFIELKKEFGSFDKYLWGFVGGKTVVNHFEKMSDLPASTPLSDEISKDLKKRGFKFVGSTIIYAYLQAIGVVFDHVTSCHVYKEFKEKGLLQD